MKIAIAICVFALCGSMKTAAQVPLEGCGCRVSGSAIGCSCPGAIDKTGKDTNRQTICGGREDISEDSIVISPGGTLTRPIPGEADLIVGESKGEIENVAKSPPLAIFMREGVVLFMPEQGPYALRNTGKQDVYVHIIRMRPTGSAGQ